MNMGATVIPTALNTNTLTKKEGTNSTLILLLRGKGKW